MTNLNSVFALGFLTLFWTACKEVQEEGILRHSDVVFMYQADRDTYKTYGATVLAWGSTPTPETRKAANGITYFSSVGMVTEFSRYHDRFPDTYEEALCRDSYGQPVKVPWLVDHQHKGIPFWWCCTRQPNFRQYLKERVVETVRAGADGIHIDDHMGTAGGLWLGLCFCDRCQEEFGPHLDSLDPDQRERLGVADTEGFNYGAMIRQWLAEDATGQRRVTDHLLWSQWEIYQCRNTVSFMEELKNLAAETAGRAIPFAANAGLLWPRHLTDYQTLDLFSSETDHEASKRQFSDLPLLAYRMADAVNRPYAATATGEDWAFIKEQNLPGLVCGWIALAYASGQHLMAPHRQWCHTEEKGTHWYEGPNEIFAPYYRFIKSNAALFDDYENAADLGVVLPYRSFTINQQVWFERAKDLASANLSYRILLAGDNIVDHPLPQKDLQSCSALLILDKDRLMTADRSLVDHLPEETFEFSSTEEAIQAIEQSVQVVADGTVRCLPRTKPGSAVIHLLNYNYNPKEDRVDPIQNVRVQINLEALGVQGAVSSRYHSPGQRPLTLSLKNDRIDIPNLELWGILELTGMR